ncbi:glycerate kinase [Kineococcus gynurae]|uniref:glycerate kinase n=1 Tax=Kineococcus gynurae TaxID=452979 RepID=UPI0035E87389
MSAPALRVLVAPDKFKGTLTAAEAAAAVAEGVRRAVPGAEVRCVPLADGGEGTVAAAVAAGAGARTARVSGPLGELVTATWALTRDPAPVAVVESAAASGLAHVDPTPATAAGAGTEGTGELLRAALDAGARRIVLGVGGTASTDGGAGLLRALGVGLRDAAGRPVARGAAGLAAVAEVDLAGLDPRWHDLDVLLAADVAVPLLGPRGAAAQFAPQKGAGPDEVTRFEAGLAHWARVLHARTGTDVSTWPWAGAGGGVCAGVHAVLGARVVSGADHVADLVGLTGHLAWADLLVVGEGRLDGQSAAGKAPVAAARRAAGLGVPTLAVVGRLDVGAEELAELGIAAVGSALDAARAAGRPEDALLHPGRWVAAAAATVLEASLAGVAR